MLIYINTLNLTYTGGSNKNSVFGKCCQGSKNSDMYFDEKMAAIYIFSLKFHLTRNERMNAPVIQAFFSAMPSFRVMG